MSILDNDKFWKIIKHIDWDGCEYDVDEAKRRMLEKVSPCNSIDFISDGKLMRLDEFREIFENIVSLINDETSRRVDKGLDSFAKNVDYGGDDCHFMDMPAHLIGRGREAVENYLNGGLIGVTNRILVVDLLRNVIPIGGISGIVITNAHRVTETSLEAFVLYIYRKFNKVSLIKSILLSYVFIFQTFIINIII